MLEALIAERAYLQHGVISLAQLRDFGLSAAATRQRVATGRLHRVYAGVYAVGHERLSGDGRYMAAVLACGADSALSHRSAADKRSLRRTNRSAIDVITPRQGGRGHAGIDAHTSATLLPRDIETVDGIPCTTVARTLLDLGAVLSRRVVERALDQADVMRCSTWHRSTMSCREPAVIAALRCCARSSPNTRARPSRATTSKKRSWRSAARPARRSQTSTPGSHSSRSATRPTSCGARNASSPRPTVATRTRRVWRSSTTRIRDQRLMLAGYRVVRFPRRQVFEDPMSVAATLRALLARAT